MQSGDYAAFLTIFSNTARHEEQIVHFLHKQLLTTEVQLDNMRSVVTFPDSSVGRATDC